MCNKVNAHLINIQISLITHVYLFSFIMLHDILDLEWVKGPKYSWLHNILVPYSSTTFKILSIGGKRPKTPKRGNWFVTWSWSVRMPHQGTHEEVNLWCNCEKHECQIFHFSQVICSTNMISVSATVLQCTNGQPAVINRNIFTYLWLYPSRNNIFKIVLNYPIHKSGIRVQKYHYSKCKHPIIKRRIR